MSHFEFLMGLVGFVGAISISSVLLFWGRVAQASSRYIRPWFLLAITIALVLNLIIHIGGIWGYREVLFDLHYKIVILLLPVIFLTLSVTTFIPSGPADEIDLQEHYFRSAKFGYVFLGVTFIVSQLVDYLPGVKSLELPLWAVIISATVVSLPAFFSSKILHVAVLVSYYCVSLLPLLLAPIV